MENEEFYKALLDELKSLSQTQKEINRSLKILARDETEKRLSHFLKSSYEIKVYQLSNGENPSTEVAKHVPISSATITRLWQKWEQLGIVETKGYHKPYRAKYSLEELVLIFGEPLQSEVPQTEEQE